MMADSSSPKFKLLNCKLEFYLGQQMISLLLPFIPVQGNTVKYSSGNNQFVCLLFFQVKMLFLRKVVSPAGNLNNCPVFLKTDAHLGVQNAPAFTRG